MIINKSYKILSVEAKDLYAAMKLKSGGELGFDIRNKDGLISLNKFENTLDWSLDTIKLQEEYEKETRKRNFYFKVGKKKYTTVVINVKFSYSYKEFNKAGENTFVKAGYTFRECVIEDGAFVKDGELIAIQTNVAVQNPLSQDILGDYFTYADGCYHQIGIIPVLKNKAELRQYLYEQGFVCDGVKYVRYKRSSGSSRVGKCLFVMEIVAARMAKWDKCGLNIKENDPIDLAAYEAYISLPMSSIIDTIQINPENILVVDDYESVFEDEVVAVEAQNNTLVANRKRTTITNNIWDGESLLDASMFGIYADKGMLLLRNRFFKTCAFNTNIQQWFADNGIKSVSQLKGFTLAADISQIKLITTPSSIKYLKFGSIEKWLSNIDTTFGVVKHEKETHFFDGRMVQCHYQLLNTLQLSYEAMTRILKPSLDYIGAVRKDPVVLRYHIGYAFKSAEEEGKINPYKCKNDIIFKMLGINDKFCQTKIYKEFRDSVVKGFYRNLKRGHILLNGNYSTLLGNGVELLQAAIGEFHGDSILPTESIHSKRFEYGKTILGTRSPHVTMGNVLLAENSPSELIDKYFNLSKEIVYINSINNNILQRLSGADMDSDTMLLTDNELLISAAKKNYEIYKVPTNLIQSKKTQRFYNSKDKADLDVKTSVNKIGEIVNLSQQLNSVYWERLHKGASVEDCEGLYNDICKLDVLSGVEIDKAKKEFTIDSAKEIDILKKKYHIDEDGKMVKPMFFKMITIENGYELSPDTVYRYFETPMDYLQKIINSTKYRQARAHKLELIPFMDVVKQPESKIKSGYYNTIKEKIIETIRGYKAAISKLFINYELKDKSAKQQVKEKAVELKLECMDIIDKMSSHEYLMYIVLRDLEAKENRDIKNLVFEVLFGKPNETFIGMINESKELLEVLTEDNSGDEQYYSFKFSRKKSA